MRRRNWKSLTSERGKPEKRCAVPSPKCPRLNHWRHPRRNSNSFSIHETRAAPLRRSMFFKPLSLFADH
jgi:hypothetical protein